MKELIVFGAGASKDSADTPLGMELVWQYYQDCCEWTPIINGKPDTSEANQDFINYVEFLKRITYYYPEFNGELDIFLNRGSMLYGGPYNLMKHHYIDDLLRRVYERKDYSFAELIRHLTFEHIVGAGFARPNKSYVDFIKKLKHKNVQDISIISFNFDFLLHEDFYEDVYFDYLIQFDFIDESRQNIYKRKSSIPLIKLNGSLDWGRCKQCKKLHLYYPHMGRNFYNKNKCQFCNDTLSPYIVIPHDEYHGNINLLWKEAKAHISNSEIITIIGYSFPEYDNKVIDLFRDNIRNDTKLIIVDIIDNGDKQVKTNDIKMKYSRLFPNIENDIEVHLNGFKGYINQRM